MMAPEHSPTGEPYFPRVRTPLLGRERERSAVRALLLRDDVPLVTLTGPGGAGKTRLAMELARDLSVTGGHQIHVVELASIQEPSLVVPAIAQAVGLVALGKQSPHDGLASYFADRPSILVLDNFEHILPAASDVADLLARCPALTVLTTSREPLRISGEHEYPVPMLSLPASEDSVERLRESEAFELFEQRAQAVKPNFEITTHNAAAVADICIQLDGLPLAIELAASRVKILSPQDIRARLVDRLTLLSRDGRDVPHRLRTMRDAVGWSYQLLTDDERRLFRRLSVFAGGCTAEMADSVLQRLDGAGSAAVFDGLTSLVDKSLLVHDEGAPGEPRFHMLETIRAYALEQLAAHGEDPAARAALADWLASRIANSFDDQWGPAQRYWTGFFEAEADNVRAALGWYLDQGNVDGASRMNVNSARCWYIRGNLAEGLSWAERTLALSDTIGQGTTRAVLEISTGWFLSHMGETDRAREMLNHALELFEANDDSFAAATCRHVLGNIDDALGRFDEAVANFEAAFRFYRNQGNRTWQAMAVGSLGHSNFELGNLDLAEAQFTEALAMFQADGNTYGAGMVLVNQAKLARAHGDLAGARRLYKESLGFRWEHRDQLGLLGCLRGLGQIEVLLGRHEEAARLFGAADALREAIGAEFTSPHSRYMQSVSTAQTQLGDKQFSAAWQQGRGTPIGDIVAMAVRVDDIDEFDRSGARAERPFGLTAREIEVLRLIREGRSNREIAEELFVSERTAQTHVQHIFTKMDVNTRAAAAATAVERQLI
jgi:predicted ATPase/DNA-binding CsgD family transcriptional regulator